MSSRKWIESRLEKLINKSDDLKEVEPDITNRFQSWTALKLIILSTVINFYTNIIGNQSYFENIYFIDALAGSGVCNIRGSSEFVIGSPIIVSELAGNFFSKMYFIDHNEEFANALENRLDYICENEDFELEEKNYEVLLGDANEKIPEVVNEIENKTNFKKCNYLAFVDNQGFNVQWEAVSKLLEPYGDLLINFQTGNYAREWGNAKSGDAESIRNLNNFFGTNFHEHEWSRVDGGEGLRNLYMEKLSEEGREIQDYITVQSRRGETFHYDMIYCTRKTAGGSPYINVFKDIKPKIEKHTGDSVDKILEIMRGTHTSIDYFFSDNGKTGQKKLDAFEN